MTHHQYHHVQVYLVAGGTTDYAYIDSDSTELLVHGASSWTYAGPLPCAIYGLQVVSLDNQVISNGASISIDDSISICS